MGSIPANLPVTPSAVIMCPARFQQKHTEAVIAVCEKKLETREPKDPTPRIDREPLPSEVGRRGQRND